MKLSEFFTSRGIRSFAIRTGIFAGIGAWIFADWRYGILLGAIVALLTSIVLPFIFYFKFLPYTKLKRQLPQPFLFDEPVRFTVKKGTIGGFFILTEKSIFFLSRECADQTLELTRDKVKSISLGKNFTIDIFLNNTQFIRIFSGAGEDLLEILRENGWNVKQ